MSTFLRVENEKIVHRKRTYKGRKENSIKIKFKKIAEERKKNLKNK